MLRKKKYLVRALTVFILGHDVANSKLFDSAKLLLVKTQGQVRTEVRRLGIRKPFLTFNHHIPVIDLDLKDNSDPCAYSFFFKLYINIKEGMS